MDSRSVSDFRSYYRTKRIEWWYSGYIHFWFISASCLAAIVYSITKLHNVTWIESLTVLVTFLVANLFEYFFHKGPMHHKVPGMQWVFNKHTVDHHSFFSAKLMAGEGVRDFKITLFPVEFVIFFGFGVLFPFGWLLGNLCSSSNVGHLFVATAFWYYLNYEWFHLMHHASKSSWVYRLPFAPWLRGLHTRHHDPRYMTHYNFNTSYPLSDRIFGTLK